MFRFMTALAQEISSFNCNSALCDERIKKSIGKLEDHQLQLCQIHDVF